VRTNAEGAYRHFTGEISIVLTLANILVWPSVNGSANGSEIGSKRILVVDDDKYVCESIRMLLEFDNHKVVAASSAEEALKGSVR
jgi:PleD family two-component response regulator